MLAIASLIYLMVIVYAAQSVVSSQFKPIALRSFSITSFHVVFSVPHIDRNLALTLL